MNKQKVQELQLKLEKKKFSISCISGCIILFVSIIFLILMVHFVYGTTNKRSLDYCNYHFNTTVFQSESEMMYPANIKICNVIYENGMITKYYFDIDKAITCEHIHFFDLSKWKYECWFTDELNNSERKNND